MAPRNSVDVFVLGLGFLVAVGLAVAVCLFYEGIRLRGRQASIDCCCAATTALQFCVPHCCRCSAVQFVVRDKVSVLEGNMISTHC